MFLLFPSYEAEKIWEMEFSTLRVPPFVSKPGDTRLKTLYTRLKAYTLT